MRTSLCFAAVLAAGGLFLSPAAGDDWPMFGRDHTHNAVSLEKGAPVDWHFAGAEKPTAAGKPAEEFSDAKNIAWKVQLGSRGIGGPVISGGLVWVGTNNARPRNSNDFKLRKDGKKDPIDKSVLMCFREADGKFLWQYAVPRTNDGSSQFVDWPEQSMGSTPLIEGDRLWIVNNRSEVVCLDISSLRRGQGVPTEIWKVDLRKQFGVFPHAPLMSAGFVASVAADSDRLYLTTGNGLNDQFEQVAAPDAPSLVCLEKTTGKTVWTDNSPGKNIMQYQISSPLVANIGGRSQCIVGQGDGWVRAFDAVNGKLAWKCDLNAKGSKWQVDHNRNTRIPIAATPVLYDNRIYVGQGVDPEHGDGPGWLFCIDPTKAGDVSPELEVAPGKGKPNLNSAVVWRYGGVEKDPAKANRDFLFGQTLGNCTLHDGLCYVSDQEGHMQCLDARTGQHYWTHDMKSDVWGSPLWVDGKVYIATCDGDVWVFAHGREKVLLAKIDMVTSSNSSPVFAKGTLYLMDSRALTAVRMAK